MKLRGVIHVHSRISYDGHESIARLAEFFCGLGYDFMCMTEHSDGLTRAEMQRIVDECAGVTKDSFVAVPGVEFSCRHRLHILGIGVTEPTDSHDPVPVARHIRAHGGAVILAHPCAYGAENPDELATHLHGIEIWNQPKDGKLGPGWKPLKLWKRWRVLNPRLRAIGALDLHRLDSPSSLTIEISVTDRSPAAIVAALKNGPVKIRGPWVLLSGEQYPGVFGELKLAAMSKGYNAMRSLRDGLTSKRP